MAESKAVYIGKLVFDDYHSFKGRNELDLIDKDGHLYQWTVFLGNNNTGKTNILKSIAYLEPTTIKSEYGDYFVPKNSMDPTSTLYNTKSSSKNLVESYLFIEPKGTNKCIAEKEIIEINLECKTNETNSNSYWGYSNVDGLTDETDITIRNLNIYSYGVTRKISNNGISEKNEDSNGASLFDPEFRLTNIEEWLFQLDYASKNGQSAADIRLTLLKEIIKSEILPEILDFRFTTTKKLKNFIEYQTKEGWFQFEQLGYGYQATMAWIIDLCKKMFERYPDSANPLKEPAIVLVDELDLHLHPKWQKTIVSYLSKTFPATQFIVTTHSPLILQTIEKINLFALIKTEDRVNIRHVPMQTLEGWSVEEILRDVMDMDEAVYSDRYYELYRVFDAALDNEDYEQAKTASDLLMEILHPTSPERKILKLQLSQITPEKTSFNTILKRADPSKINVVKTVKELTGLGLKDAKKLVDGPLKIEKDQVAEEFIKINTRNKNELNDTA